MTRFVIGQRWSSEMEPELGVGIVEAVEGRRLRLKFPESGLVRLYAAASAPLQRVVFQTGDRVVDRRGTAITVGTVDTEAGLLVYSGEGMRLREDQLTGTLAPDTPRQRLMAGRRDPGRLFDLRRRILDLRRRMVGSPVYGLVGGRVDLIPHQIAIAVEVSGRRRPRVLLADEAGLGKTIEAGLILHRLAATGRIQRILVIVPDALVVQWYVELVRRFNLRFRIFDDTLTAGGAVPASDGGPFADEALGLCGFSFLNTASPACYRQLLDAQWDMLVVDEAHHLQPGGTLFERVRQLSHAVPRMLLITATPGHLAARSHFARLQLLDPDRYPGFRRFQRETRMFEGVARLVKVLANGGSPASSEVRRLARELDIPLGAVDGEADPEAGSRRLVQRIIDRYGPGRAMFKTTRRSVEGFPDRRVHLSPLDAGAAVRRRIDRDVARDCGLDPAAADRALADDPRLEWLVAFLRGDRERKVLLICRSAETVNALYAELETRINLRVGRYHEAMTLVQRDRNAAWFAEPKGAVLLICSEIGSEGRNFQFARHLVLFDLPADPELMEQRIGRLDRIGQTGVIQVLVPYVRGTAAEILARWYQEALDAFERHVPAAGWVTRRLWRPLSALIRDPSAAFSNDRLVRLLRCGRIAVVRQQRRIESGRDRLLEMDALPAEQVARLIAEIRDVDADAAFAETIERLLDVRGIVMEPIADKVFRLTPDQRYADPLPGFRPTGLTATVDRSLALAREELEFLSWDHPLVAGAMDHFLGSGTGDAAFVCWPMEGDPALFLEMLFVIEATALVHPALQSFLPATPLRVVIDHRLEDGAPDLPDRAAPEFVDGSAAAFARILPVLAHQVPRMVETGRAAVRERAEAVIADAARRAQQVMGETVDRLQALRRINAAIGEAEVRAARQERDTVVAAISGARTRLDALRLVLKGTEP